MKSGCEGIVKVDGDANPVKGFLFLSKEEFMPRYNRWRPRGPIPEWGVLLIYILTLAVIAFAVWAGGGFK